MTAKHVDKNWLSESPRQMLITLRLSGQRFGVPVERVRDVFREQRMTRVPMAPPEIAGLINLRGRIVTVINMRERLGLAPAPSSTPRMCVVVEHKGEYFSLLVDAIGEVLTVPADEIESSPANLEEAWRKVSAGIYKLEKELLVLLDIPALLGIHHS